LAYSLLDVKTCILLLLKSFRLEKSSATACYDDIKTISKQGSKKTLSSDDYVNLMVMTY